MEEPKEIHGPKQVGRTLQLSVVPQHAVWILKVDVLKEQGELLVIEKQRAATRHVFKTTVLPKSCKG